ncbi:MAG: hypothetical protein US66_C0014G0001, partial [Candidatus Moranbacteria bacterium GW2011_GWD2_37_9]
METSIIETVSLLLSCFSRLSEYSSEVQTDSWFFQRKFLNGDPGAERHPEQHRQGRGQQGH